MRIFVCLLALLLFCGCGVQKNNSGAAASEDSQSQSAGSDNPPDMKRISYPGVICDYPDNPQAREEAKQLASVEVTENSAFAVHDYNSNVTCAAHRDKVFYSASTVKVATITAMFWQTEKKGTEPSQYWLNLAEDAITVSDNESQSTLWGAIDGTEGMDAFYKAAGMNDSVAKADWGLSLTSAEDYLTLIDHLVKGDLINRQHSDYVLDLMSKVAPEQAWGITGGAPEGAKIMLKNGWLDLYPGQIAGESDEAKYMGGSFTWTVHSGGWVKSDNESYALVVMSDLNNDYGSGSNLVTKMSENIATIIKDKS